MNIVAQVLYKFRFIFLILIIGVTVALIPSLRVEQDNTLQAWFEKTNSTYVNYKNFQEEFNISEFELIVLKTRDIFSYEILQYIKEKTFELENVNYIERVHSLANANKILKIQEGIEVKPLLEEINKNILTKIKKEALNDKLFKNYLISENGKVACIIVNTKKELEEKQQEKHKVLSEIKKIMKKGKPDRLELYFSGDLEVLTTFDKCSNELVTKTPIFIISLMFICIILIYRSIAMFFIIVISILFSLIWTIGTYNLLGYTFNAVTGMLIPFILILSIANIIHIIEYFDEIRSTTNNKKEGFIKTVEYITKPCFLTSLTTAFGFFSLTFSDVKAIKTFGFGCTIGVIGAFITAISIVPLFLTLLPQKDMCKKKLSLNKLNNLLNSLFSFVEHRHSLILVISIAIFIVASCGLPRLNVSTNYFEYFPDKSPINKSARLLDKTLSGNRSLEIFMEGEENILIHPEILKKMENISLEIQRLPHVKKVISLVDYIKEINNSLTGEYNIPSSKEIIAQELFLFTLSNQGLRDIKSFTAMDYSKGRISVNIGAIPSKELQDLSSIIEKKGEEIFHDTDIKFTLTGEGKVWSVLDTNLTRGQMSSFSMAFLQVMGLIFIVFRSLKYGILSILPNITPIFLCLGFIGWFDIKVNVATVMVASIALGVGVDDTIHFISRFIKERKEKEFIESLKNSIVCAGGPVILTLAINIIGFSTLLFATFQPAVHFGILISSILFSGFIAEIFILPTTMILLERMKKN